MESQKYYVVNDYSQQLVAVCTEAPTAAALQTLANRTKTPHFVIKGTNCMQAMPTYIEECEPYPVGYVPGFTRSEVPHFRHYDEGEPA